MKNKPEQLLHLLEAEHEPSCAYLGVVLALVTISDFKRLKSFLTYLLEKELHLSKIYEVLLQSHLFAGFPRALVGLQIFRELLKEKGLEILGLQEAEKPVKGLSRLQKGKNLFKRIYGKNTGAVLESLRALHPHYDRWVLEDAYGRILSRPFLSGRTRELCAVAALTVTGAPEQLRSHIMGAIHLGAKMREIKGIIKSMEVITDKKKIDDALEILAGLDLK